MTAPVDAAARLAVADQHLQAIARGIGDQVDQRVRRLDQGTAGLRRVTVASRDPAARTCQVYLDGDTSTPAPCGLLSRSVVPVVGELGWALANGTDLLLTGVEVGRPRAQIRTLRNDQPVGAGLVGIDFTAANGGVVIYDTDSDGLNAMADLTSGRLTARWPGQYHAQANVRMANKITAGADVMEIVLNDASLVARSEISTTGAAHLHCGGDVTMAAGDYLRIYVQSVGSNTTVGYAAGDVSGVSTRLAVHYIE